MGLRAPLRTSLTHQLAAVDLDDLTYQVVGGRRSEESDDPGCLLGGALASHRDGLLQVLAYIGGCEPVVERGGYYAWGDTVYEYVLGDEFLGHRAGQGAEATFGCGVGDGAWTTAVASRDRGHVDDLAAPLPPHDRQHRPRDQVDALQVHVHHPLPEVIGHLGERPAFDQGPRVVDQDVEPPETILYLPDHPPYLVRIRDVATDERSLPARSIYLPDHLPRLILARVVMDHHPSSLPGERHGDGAPDPRAAPRYPRYLIRECHPTVTSLWFAKRIRPSAQKLSAFQLVSFLFFLKPVA